MPEVYAAPSGFATPETVPETVSTGWICAESPFGGGGPLGSVHTCLSKPVKPAPTPTLEHLIASKNSVQKIPVRQGDPPLGVTSVDSTAGLGWTVVRELKGRVA